MGSQSRAEIRRGLKETSLETPPVKKGFLGISLSSLDRTTIRNTGWLVLGEGAFRGSRFLVTVLLARYLGVSDFGTWSFAIALAALFMVIANFGLPAVTVRDIAVNKSNTLPYARSMVALKAVLGLGMLGFIALVGLVLSSEREELWLIYLLGIFVLLASYAELFHAMFRAHDRMNLEAYAKLILGASLLVLGGALIWRSAPLLLFGLAFVVAAAMALVFTVVLFIRLFGWFRPRVDLDFWKSVLRTSFPILLATVAFVAYFRIDMVMLQQMKGDRETGLYSAAFNFVFPLAFLAIFFVQALFPTLSRQASHLRELTQTYLKATALLLVYAVAVAAALVATREVVYLRLFGTEYEDSVAIIPALVGALSLFYFAHLNCFVLYARRRDRTVLGITLASLALAVALNLALIPSFGIHGAALGTLATEAFVLGLLLFSNKDVLRDMWRRPPSPTTAMMRNDTSNDGS